MRAVPSNTHVLAGSLLGEAGRNKAMGASSPMCECVPSTNNNTGPASSNLSPIEILEGTAPTEDPNVTSLYNCCGVAAVSYTHLTLPTICSV